ncbi:MAG: GNAT family N-acetyltransferase [Alicyclobacillus sp.]|nr:GNAT family N-acetyltransferase [Alicyclobacillus sp.]
MRPLILVLPFECLQSPSEAPSIPGEYMLRTYQDGDKRNLGILLASEGWGHDEATIDDYLDHVVPDGLFFVVHQPTGEIVATACALHHPRSPHWHFPFGGDIGYVIVRRDHRGRGIGYAVSVAAVNRLIQAGYKNIRVVTNDHRRDALKSTSNLALSLSFIQRIAKNDGRTFVLISTGLICRISGLSRIGMFEIQARTDELASPSFTSCVNVAL